MTQTRKKTTLTIKNTKQSDMKAESKGRANTV